MHGIRREGWQLHGSEARAAWFPLEVVFGCEQEAFPVVRMGLLEEFKVRDVQLARLTSRLAAVFGCSELLDKLKIQRRWR